MSIKSKNKVRQHRKIRIRKKIFGTANQPRLVVFRSNLHIYAQLIDDIAGCTLLTASTLSLKDNGISVRANKSGSTLVGKEIARLAIAKQIMKVVFDRNGYLYHGRVKAVADGAREGGLKF